MSEDRARNEVEEMLQVFHMMEDLEANGADVPLHPPVALQEVFLDMARGMVQDAGEAHDSEPLARIYLTQLATAYELGSRMAERGKPFSSLLRCQCGSFSDVEWEGLLRDAS